MESTTTYLPFEPGINQILQTEVNPSTEHALTKNSDISILVVEDERINYRLLEVMLKHMSVRVEHAINGQVAIDLVLKNHYDLVFMDMHMPVMGGIEATKRLKTLCPNLPIIALTASVMKEDIQCTLDAGCDDVLYKPTRRDQLNDAIRKYTSYS